MLDNMGLVTMRTNAGTGMDYISVAALTQDIQAVDLSVRFTRQISLLAAFSLSVSNQPAQSASAARCRALERSPVAP